MADESVKVFMSIGLSEQKAKETLKNKNVSENLKSIITEVSYISVWLRECSYVSIYSM